MKQRFDYTLKHQLIVRAPPGWPAAIRDERQSVDVDGVVITDR
jgi:hypothetical protein